MFYNVGMETGSDLERRIAGIAALDHPLRRELYRVLADCELTRDDAAAALDVALRDFGLLIAALALARLATAFEPAHTRAVQR